MTILVPVLDPLISIQGCVVYVVRQSTTPPFYVHQVCHSYTYPSNMTLVSIVPIQVLAVNQFECIFPTCINIHW